MQLLRINDPKVMAYSGLIAMLPKSVITLILAIITAILINNLSTILLIFVITYPIVGFVVDFLLYVLRNKIWDKDIANVPENFAISTPELVKYAICTQSAFNKIFNNYYNFYCYCSKRNTIQSFGKSVE